MGTELHRTDCAISNDTACTCGGGIPVSDEVPPVPFDREAWTAEFARLNPGREDCVFREYDGGAIVEHRGKPPTMPAMTQDGRIIAALGVST